MELNQLAQLISPIHGVLQRLSGSEIERTGIFPERLTLVFDVVRERENKFVGAIKRILAVTETFGFESHLCVFVSRSVQLLPNGELDFSEWLVQFQVNQGKAFDSKVIENQVQAILFELESYIYD